MFDNKILIIGGEHHNGLNLARLFGINNICVEAFVIANVKTSFISKSKYVSKTFVFGSENDALDYIKENYSKEEYKPFIFPYSDGAAMCLDNRLDEFFDNFIFPSINSSAGSITRLMDKNVQYRFAKENNINIAESYLLNLKKDNSVILSQLKDFPYILKPNISAVGKKTDILVCNSVDVIKEGLEKFKNKGYSEVFTQQYLKVGYECVLVGAVYNSERPSDFVVHKVIRKWPEKTGSGTYDTLITDTLVVEQCKALLDTIKKTGFRGLIDIEVFVINGKLFLNEINWRNSGGDYRSLTQKFCYPYWWCLDYLGIDFTKEYTEKKGAFSITDITDYNNVVNKKISYKEWRLQNKTADNHSLIYKDDPKPARYVFVRSWYKLVLKTILPRRLINYLRK